MTAEQGTIALAAVVVLKEAYNFFTAGQKFDDRVKKQINEVLELEKKAKETEASLKKQLSDKELEFMAADIKRISDAISEIGRMLRESVATKQDILQMDARMDAVEESNRDHYESFKKLREELSSLRVSCARHHSTGRDTAALERARA